jgi:hypothetical protein
MNQLRLFQLPLLPLTPPGVAAGAVFTRPWVVSLILDLVGYTVDQDLAGKLIIEPSAGHGAFLGEIVRRLLASCARRGLDVTVAANAILACELDARSAASARSLATGLVAASGSSQTDALELGAAWVKTCDYLLECDPPAPADFVVGNPPYIRLEDMEERAARYRSEYPTMVGRADIYVAFLEAGLRQLAPGGKLGFICADRWMRNQYGAGIRRFVTSGFAVNAIVEMHNAVAFDDDVSAYPAVVSLERSAQGPAVVAWAQAGVEVTGGARIARHLQAVREHTSVPPLEGISAARIDQWFTGDDPWPLVEPQRLALLRRLERAFPSIEASGAVVGIGVATGADGIFVTKDTQAVEADRLLPLAMAKDARGDAFAWSGHYLVNPWADHGLADLNAFPRLRAYFERHACVLRARHVARKGGGWFRTIDRVDTRLTSRSKLYLPDFAARSSPMLDPGGTYPHHNVYFICSDVWDLQVLGGLLLSDIAQMYLEAFCVRMRGGYLRFQAQYLRRLRVPRPEALSEALRGSLREAFVKRDTRLATQVAFEAYGLSEEDRHAVGSVCTL